MNAVKIIQTGTPADNDLLQKYKPGREAAEQRLWEILYLAVERRDEANAWFGLVMAREYLMAVPADKDPNALEPLFKIGYLSILTYLIDALNRPRFCWACDQLSNIIQLGYVAYPNIQDAVLHVLIEHPNMDYAQAAPWFLMQTEGKRA